MSARTMDELVALEKKHGLTEDGLTYQQRLSRISKVLKGESWDAPEKKVVKRGMITSPSPRELAIAATKLHPLYGKKLLITPMMVPDKDRNVYFEEPVGHDIQVEEIEAGKLLYGQGADVDRLIGDYRVVQENPNRVITAKTTLPKSGQEISYTVGKDLVPVVRGNDGQRGYVWAIPTHMRQVGNTMVQILGLKTLITQIAPELLPKFSNKPVMMYIDGLFIAASIPQTEAILKEYRQKELRNAQLGLV